MTDEQTTAFAIPPDDLPAIEQLHRYIDEVAPDNEAPIPIAMSLELVQTKHGRVEWKWLVYVHVRTPAHGDIDIDTDNVSLREAVLSALRFLRTEVGYTSKAA